VGFTDNPIINAPFEKPQWHFELDDEGQPTGKKLPDRRESVQVVPVPAAKRRGPAALRPSLRRPGSTPAERWPRALRSSRQGSDDPRCR